MKVLNLVNPNNGILFTVNKFPDGQQQISINKGHGLIKNVIIKSRLNNFLDLEKIICATKSLKTLGTKNIYLEVPYFLGSRSDRSFKRGENNYLKDVICPIINRLKFKMVTILDPHSDVLEACLKNFHKIPNSRLVAYAIGDLYKNFDNNKFILISPDAGAQKKIYQAAEAIKYTGEIITCSKHRNAEGKLTETVVPLFAPNFGKDLIIIDDICDGGATFINIAAKIDEIYNNAYDWQGPKPKKYLIVTHGIFSKGFSELAKYFDGIYCTNSYGDALAQRDGDLQYQSLVKQMNVF